MTLTTRTKSRLEVFEVLRERLSQMRDESLMTLLASSKTEEGIGRSSVVELDGYRVFAKRIPVTDDELDHECSTENIFEIPSFYHYGVGSLGFGVYRELAMQRRATEWVLSGECDLFPLMYHDRVLPFSGETFTMSADELDEYVAYWDGNPAIHAYVLARRRAKRHAVMFVEYVPHVLRRWLSENLWQLTMVTTGMHEVLDFLREKGVCHFDAHLGNVLTDGRQIFLTDFGLALDKAWRLEADELAFLRSHRHYDAGTFARSLSRPLREMISHWDEQTKDHCRAHCGEPSVSNVLDNLDWLIEAGALSVPAAYHEALLRNRNAIRTMDRTVTALRNGSKAAVKFDDDELRRALPMLRGEP